MNHTEMRNTEETLLAKEKTLRLLVEYAPAAIAMFDNNMRYVAVSRRYLKDYGISQGNIIGRSHYEIFPEIPENLKEIHKRCLSGRSEKSEPEPFVRHTGSIDWVSWEIHPWYESGESIGGIILFSEVVTEYKRTEAALYASEQRWKFALEGAGDGVWDWDCQTNHVFYSRQWKAMLGYTETEIDHTLFAWEDLIHPEDKHRVFKDLKKLIEGNASDYANEHRLKCKNDTYKWVLDRGMVVKQSDKSGPLRIIGTLTDISYLKQTQESLEKNVRTLRILSECNNLLVRSREESSLLEGICKTLVTQAKYAFAWVGFVQDDYEKTILPVAYSGSGRDYLSSLAISLNGKNRKVMEGPVASSFISGKPNIIQDTSDDSRFELWREKAKEYGYSSVVALPLADGEKVFGSLNLYSLEPEAFNEEEIKLLTELANNLAFGLTDLRLQEKHKSILDELNNSEHKLLIAMTKTVELISKTVELRDPYTAGHQERVTSLAVAIAKKIGLTDTEVQGIRMAAIVHDLGKMYVPAEILSKPGKLSNPEFELIKTHAKAGYDIIKEVEFPWPIAEIILQHHERINGSGYPNQLSGSEITFGARIIAVADVVESMVSHRPYRPALGVEKALEEISEFKGVLYDSTVVNACILLFNEGYSFD